jgi:hypothetical protein
MSTTLTNEEKIAIVSQHIKNVEYSLSIKHSGTLTSDDD